MKKGQIYEGVIKEVDFPNKAVVYVTEETETGQIQKTKVAIKGGIAGQTVSFAIKKARKDKCQGQLLQVIKKSPLETEKPACHQFGVCGGCMYQSIPYERQLEIKKNQVLKLIDGAIGKKTYFFDGIFSSPDIFGYRNKMEFSFGDEVKDGPLTLGLHKKGSFHDIINADCCKLVHPDFTNVLTCVREYCAEREIPHYRKKSHEGVLRHLLVRRAASTGEMLVALVVSSQQMLDWSSLTDRLRKLDLEGKLVGFLLMINDSLGDVIQSDRTEILYGTDHFTEEILGLKFQISPFSFFQTNTRGAAVLYQRVREYVLNGSATDQTAWKDKVVFDLYSGTGTIAQMLAPVAKKVIGVEIVKEAVLAARKNAKENNLPNCEFIAGDVLKVIDEIEERPDYIVLDPPRDGIHPKALRKIVQFGVENIVYISCKPTSLARDLVLLEEAGYRLERVSCVDMFAQTGNVETVCLLGNQKSERT
ncbi:MAG: 23S rRNA (uracil(1939)-C(5))-methyltransferase RlmD [Clostridiaceae bacterium]|nr:23S rRNA (uracil(1939)-C(5))-methyltransferase RlmD [Clostridiaceae bacterium]